MTSTMVFIDHPANDLNAGRDTCVISGRSIDLNASYGANYETLVFSTGILFSFVASLIFQFLKPSD